MNQMSRRRSLESIAALGATLTLSGLFPSVAEARPRRHSGQNPTQGRRPPMPPPAPHPSMGWAVVDQNGNLISGLAENQNTPGAIASLTKVWTAAVLFDEMDKPGSN